MIHHVVVVRLNSDVTSETRDEIIALIQSLSRQGLAEKFEFGLDAGLGGANNADLALVAQFRDEDALRTYLEHDAHLAVVRRLVPVAQLSVVQYVSPATD